MLFSVKLAVLFSVLEQQKVDNSRAGPNWEQFVQFAYGRPCMLLCVIIKMLDGNSMLVNKEEEDVK